MRLPWGDVTLKNSAQSTTEFYVLGTVDVGVNAIGTGTMTVSDPGTLLETGDLIVGNAGTGSLDIKNFGAAHVRVGGTTTVGQAGSGTVRIHTNGTLETNSASLAVAATGTANVEIVGGGAKWQINGDLNIADRGRGKVKEIDGGEVIANNIKIALLEGANGTLEAIGAGSIARTTVSVEAGLDAAAVEAIVAVYDGGVVNSEADVLLNGGSTVKGNSAVIAANGITASNYTVIVAPGNTDGSPATLTFDSPQYRAGAATTLDIDAPEGGVNDHLHVSGTVSLNGNVSATVGFDPVPWRLDGTGGDYIHVLSSVGALTGTMTGSLPPIESFDLPPPEPGAHYEWKIIYDRNDATPDGALVNQSQPWVGNGTRDVVLVIREVPPFDPYETYGEGVFDIDENGTTITLGDDTRGEEDTQPAGFHGGSICLAPAAEYVITVSYNLATWDSYNEDTGPGTGYWDSFSISVTDEPFYSLSLEDPLPFPFVWGGAIWGDAVLDATAGTITLTIPGNAEEPSYLNLVLDTLTPPTMDELYPSWGTFTITTPLETCSGGESLLGGGGGGSLMSGSSGGFFGLEGAGSGTSSRGGGGMLLLSPSSPESGAEGEMLPPLAPIMGSGLAGAGLPGAGQGGSGGDAIAAGPPPAFGAPPQAASPGADFLISVDFLFSRAASGRSHSTLRTELPEIAVPRPIRFAPAAVQLPGPSKLTAPDLADGAEDAPDDLEWLFDDPPLAC